MDRRDQRYNIFERKMYLSTNDFNAGLQFDKLYLVKSSKNLIYVLHYCKINELFQIKTLNSIIYTRRTNIWIQ